MLEPRAAVAPRAAWDAPLFIRESDGARASRLASLVARSDAVDASRLACRVLSLTPHAWLEKTAYRGVARPVPAGLAPSVLPPLETNEAELVSSLRAELEAAVARAMRDTKRVAIMVGGGVDSSVLTALAVAEARRRGDVTVIPIALDYASDGDDRPHLRALSAALGVEPVRVKPEDAGPIVTSSFVADASPATWPSVPLELAMAAAALREGAEVIMTGAGGDDLFDGSPYVLSDLARHHPLRAVRDAARLVLPWRVSTPRRVADFVVRPFVSPRIPAPIRAAHRRRRLDRAHPWAGPEARRALAAIAAEAPRPTRTPEERYARFATSAHLVEVATLRTQFESASGLRRVDPFLDEALVAFTCRIAPAAFLMGHRLRGLFREAARGLVPDSVRLRTDKAAFEPAQARMVEAAGGFGALEPLARAARAADLGLVEPRVFRAEWDAFVRDPIDHDWLAVWPTLAVEAFLQGVSA